jgi:hypothetical protein
MKKYESTEKEQFVELLQQRIRTFPFAAYAFIAHYLKKILLLSITGSN